MTKQQQLECEKIIARKGGEIDDWGWLSKDMTVYTTTIDELRGQDAQVYYNPSDRRMKISNWNEFSMKEPGKPKESATKMEVRAFYDEDYKIQLVKEDGGGHDHLHLIYKGEDLGYLHIDKDRVQWCPYAKAMGDQFIRIGEDC